MSELAAQPSAASPERGWIVVRDHPILEAERWVDAERWMIRALEFPIFADGADADEAAANMGNVAADYFGYLADMAPGERAENEEEQLGLLARRYAHALTTLEEELRQLLTEERRRRRELGDCADNLGTGRPDAPLRPMYTRGTYASGGSALNVRFRRAEYAAAHRAQARRSVLTPHSPRAAASRSR